MTIHDRSIAAVVLVFAAVISAGAQLVPPANDSFDNAQVIVGVNGYLQGTNVDASTEPGEPLSCPLCATVWYQWTAPANLSMTFETVMQTVTPDDYLADTVIGVYSGGNVAKLQTLTWNDDISAERGNRRSRVTFAAEAGQVYNIRIYGKSATEGLFLLSWEINGAESWKQSDFDGCSPFDSRKSDFGIFRPSDGTWWLNAEFSIYKTIAWGMANDIPVPADYFGEGCSDIAIWRPADGTYWILDNPSGSVTIANWGLPGDVPVRGDFDGDDKADLAIYRGGEQGGVNQFWILNSSDGSVRVDSIGFEVWDIVWTSPFVADYDGDGKTDIGIVLHSWWGRYGLIKKSSDGSQEGIDMGWDDLVTGDFDYDGKCDVAYWGNQPLPYYHAFKLRRSSDGLWETYRWGMQGDIPVSGDYGGSTGSDLCVWRPSDGNLYCYDPIGQTSWQYKWGTNGDIPLPRQPID
jgi:hypothetical protein